MYSITQSPTLAVDLAHAVMDEKLRRAAASTSRRTPKRPGQRIRLPRLKVWTRRPAIAV